jgi:tryptophanyl-tRNA synthetase
VEQLWNSIEKSINDLTQTSKLSLKKYEYSSEEAALDALGSIIMDGGQVSSRDKRLKKERKEGTTLNPEPVFVGHLLDDDGSTRVLALLHGDQLLELPSLGSIKIMRGKNESSVVCNKKKCEVIIKFCVIPKEECLIQTSTPAPSNVTDIDMSKCTEKTIRDEEGLKYKLYMEQMALEAMKVDDSPAVPVQNTPTSVAENNDDMVVTAFEVSGNIDYSKLIDKFGSKPLTPYLLKRLENVTVKRGTVTSLHRFLRREIFFSHRDIEKICELLEEWYGISPPPENETTEDSSSGAAAATSNVPTTQCPFYLYTGRGPSSSAMHLGHLVPFLFTAWLQKAFRCPLVIQMTDDEKFLFKGEYSSENAGDGEDNNDGQDPNRTGDNLDHFANLTIENAKDIIACDFIKDKTFLFSDLDYVGRMYPNIVRIWKAVTVNQVNGVFGFDASSNIGKVAFPAIQAAPSFGSSFPNVLGGGTTNASTLACLIPCAIDQDPYFRLTRDIAHKLVPRHHPTQGKPALIHSKFFPPLQGAQGKMSSSDTNSAIFLTDTPEDIERKIKVHAFSGGQETKKLQEELGANLDVDVSYQWLRFFLEDDDELARIGESYGSGKGEFWSTGKVKAKLVEVLKDLVAAHQNRRKDVSEEVVKEWMSERCIL